MAKIPKPDTETQDVIIGDKVIKNIPSFDVYAFWSLIETKALSQHESPSKVFSDTAKGLVREFGSEKTLRNMRRTYDSEQEELRFLEAKRNAPESEQHKFQVYTQAEIDALENDGPS